MTTCKTYFEVTFFNQFLFFFGSYFAVTFVSSRCRSQTLFYSGILSRRIILLCLCNVWFRQFEIVSHRFSPLISWVMVGNYSLVETWSPSELHSACQHIMRGDSVKICACESPLPMMKNCCCSGDWTRWLRGGHRCDRACHRINVTPKLVVTQASVAVLVFLSLCFVFVPFC